MHPVILLKDFEDGGMTYRKGSTIRLTTEAVAAWSALGRCEPLASPLPPAAPEVAPTAPDA